jgi:4-hydroxy 2-oxovalerate aldolase
LDASIGGLGRGAGNCPMELLLSVVNAKNYKLRPIIECLENALVPLRREIEWGPLPEYMLTGQFNQHPRAAIAARKEPETRDRFLALYDRLFEKEAEAK